MPRLAPAVFVALSAVLTVGTPAHAGEEYPLSQVVDEGWMPVLVVQTEETTCISFQVDEWGNRWADFETWASVEEVLSQGEDNEDSDFVVGESILLHWVDFAAGVPDPDAPRVDGCTQQYLSLRDDQRLALALTLDGEHWVPSAWTYDDLGHWTASDTPLPSCGEDLQEGIVSGLRGGDADAGEDDPGGRGEAAGCSVVSRSPAGGLALILGLVGLVRRRRV